MRGGIIGAATGVFGMLVAAGPALAQAQANGTQPAGGAALGEALGATAGAMVATALVVLLISRHRAGAHGHPESLRALGREADRAARLGVRALDARGASRCSWPCSGCTGTSPCTSTTAATPVRSPTPAHYLILVGLYGVLVAGVMSIGAVRHRAPGQDRRAPRRRLVGPDRRSRHDRMRRLRAGRLPAGRHLAPAVRPGRDPLGPDPPELTRRRRRSRPSAA